MLDLSDRTRTGISILTSAADYFGSIIIFDFTTRYFGQTFFLWATMGVCSTPHVLSPDALSPDALSPCALNPCTLSPNGPRNIWKNKKLQVDFLFGNLSRIVFLTSCIKETELNS